MVMVKLRDMPTSPPLTNLSFLLIYYAKMLRINLRGNKRDVHVI